MSLCIVPRGITEKKDKNLRKTSDKIPYVRTPKPKKQLRNSSINFQEITVEDETLNLFRMMLTGAVQNMSPRSTLAMINVAGLADAKINSFLSS